jgi:hypothetical protein
MTRPSSNTARRPPELNAPSPNSALARAARHEETRVDRALATLEQRRAALRAQLEDLDREEHDLTRRRALLDELLGTEPDPPPAAAPPAEASPGAIRGRRTRCVAARLLWTTSGIQPMHYRELYERVLAAGYAVTGRDPLASFLTNLRDSPAIARTARPGYYQVDPASRDRTAEALRDVWADLDDAAAALDQARRGPAAGPELEDSRRRRDELQQRLKRLEADERELEDVFDDADAATPAS